MSWSGKGRGADIGRGGSLDPPAYPLRANRFVWHFYLEQSAAVSSGAIARLMSVETETTGVGAPTRGSDFQSVGNAVDGRPELDRRGEAALEGKAGLKTRLYRYKSQRPTSTETGRTTRLVRRLVRSRRALAVRGFARGGLALEDHLPIEDSHFHAAIQQPPRGE